MSTDPSRQVPASTYRLQLHEGFTLDDAAAAVDYLADLGVTHVYCSPILQAAPHSLHGYDVVDHSRINAELGGREAFDRLSAACREHGLGIVLDIVPNHMAVNVDGNAQWWDVLKHGRESVYAGWFDIDWDAPAAAGRVVLPVLGAPLDVLLAAGELTLAERAGEPVVRYYGTELPVAPGTAGAGMTELLESQHYLLVHWRDAALLNYRRFFDVASLAGLRVEEEKVFEATHAVVLALIAAGQVDGLRVDHPDGLADPGAYFSRLHAASGGAWVVAEKILEPGEHLDHSWRLAGTTGYDALNDVNAVFVDPAGEAFLTDLFADITGVSASWPDLVHAAKLQVLDQLFAAELGWLVRVARADVPADDLSAALREFIACFPVYRSYLRTGELPHDADLTAIATARAEAIRRRPELAGTVGLLVDEVLDVSRDSELRVRFQQTTGPVMAKGVEDTAFYRYHRLVSLNEVGGDPGSFGSPVEQFHAACAARQRDWPDSMTALSTHDTKRSEDVRARISLLAQCPEQWAGSVRRWVADNEKYWTVEPDRAMEYLLYQTIVGAWPLPLERAQAYAEKASREAKQRTSWIDPDPAYRAALHSFVASVYADEGFVRQVEEFAAQLSGPGALSSTAQKLVQLTMPGVPDIYQGTELRDLSLVDPDNRRPVDYAERRRLLAQLGPPTSAELFGGDDRLVKLFVLQRTLALRKRLPDVFARGDYEGLAVEGQGAQGFLAFARGGSVVTAVPRLGFDVSLRLPAATLALPAGTWRNEFTGATVTGTVAMAELLADFPVALLSRP